jgi:hypothetical protein
MLQASRNVAAACMKARSKRKRSMAGLVLTLPIAAGKVEAWRRFCQELSGSRRQQYEASRRRLAITAERLSLIETPMGSASVTTLEASDVGLALARMIGSNLPFETWYRERLQDLHGINLTHYEDFAVPTPPAHTQELLFEWVLPAAAAA